MTQLEVLAMNTGATELSTDLELEANDRPTSMRSDRLVLDPFLRTRIIDTGMMTSQDLVLMQGTVQPDRSATLPPPLAFLKRGRRKGQTTLGETLGGPLRFRGKGQKPASVHAI